MLPIGSRAPAWKDLPGVDGKRYASTDFEASNVVVLAFFSNTCPVAADYVERMKALANRYAHDESKVRLVAININVDQPMEKLEAMKSRAKKDAFNFPYLLDKSQRLGVAYGVDIVPAFLVLDKERHVVYRGAMDDHQDAKRVKKQYVKEVVEALLDGKPLPYRQTRPYGCPVNYLIDKSGRFIRTGVQPR